MQLHLEDWIFDTDVADENRVAEVSVYIGYPGLDQYIHLPPKERVEQIDAYHQDRTKKLKSLSILRTIEAIGTNKRPRGVKTKIAFNDLQELNTLDYISSVDIYSITGAHKNITQVPIVSKFYCVKMTVVIDIEGVSNKTESIEERMVLIKADSNEDAYSKLESQKENYATPYLNSGGRLVKWRIESFDDCYETDILSPQDIENPEGVEVYSKLKTRKRKS